jgi:hypothetical protein
VGDLILGLLWCSASCELDTPVASLLSGAYDSPVGSLLPGAYDSYRTCVLSCLFQPLSFVCQGYIRQTSQRYSYQM